MNNKIKTLIVILIIFISQSIFGYDKIQNIVGSGDEVIENGENEIFDLIENKISFTFAGDALFARGVEKRSLGDFDSLFEKLPKDLFTGSNIGILNFENAIRKDDSYRIKSIENLKFLAPEISVKTISNLGFNFVSLANNHSNNDGREGLIRTNNAFEKFGIKSIGSAKKAGYEIIKGKGVTAALICVNLTLGKIDILDDIVKLKQENDYVIVFPHFGTEYNLNHSKTQEKYAHKWIESGADLIIGSHPHVIQDIEIYKGKPIIYSLGNFLFDQGKGDVNEGLIVKGEISIKGIELLLIPITNISKKVEIADGEIKEKILNRITNNITNYLDNENMGRVFIPPE